MITDFTIEPEKRFNRLTTGRTISLAVFFIIALTIPITTILTQQQQSTSQQASAPPSLTSDTEIVIQSLTNQLLQEIDKPHDVTIAYVELLSSLAAPRKEKLLELANIDPALFLLRAALTSRRGDFPVTVQKDIEEQVTLTGTYLVVNSSPKPLYQLHVNSSFYALHFVQFPTALKSGSVVSVSGIKLDNDLILPPNPFLNITPVPTVVTPGIKTNTP